MDLVETNNNNNEDFILKSHFKSNIDEATDDSNNNNNEKPKNDDVANMDESDRIPNDFSHINLNSIVKKREKLSKFLKNVSNSKNQETEEIIPIEQVLNQTFKEESKSNKSSSIDHQLNGEKTKHSSTESTIQSLNVSLYQLFERLELISSGQKLNYRITLKENCTNDSLEEVKLRFYGSKGKTKKFKLSNSELDGYDFNFRYIGEIIALSLEYTNDESSLSIVEAQLIDLKKNEILNFEANDWFHVKLEKNKLASFMFKSIRSVKQETRAQPEIKFETATEELQEEIKDFKAIIKELKPFEKKLKNLLMDKKILINFKQIEKLSDNKDVAFDGFLVRFLLSNIEYQLRETKVVKSNVKLLLRILTNLTTNNSSYIIEIGSNEKNLCSISSILTLLLKANFNELEEALVNIIYSIAKESYFFYNKWIDSNIFQNLLEILETQDSISYEISNRIFQIVKVSYNYNNATDSNISFGIDDESEGVNIFKYIGQLRIDSSLFKSLKFRNAFMYMESLNIRFKELSGSNRIILMKFLTILTKTLVGTIQNDLEMIDFKKYDIIKTVAYLVQILSMFEKFTQSADFCFEFQKNEYSLKLLFNFITNDTNLSYVLKEFKFQYIVLEHLYTKIIDLIVIVFKVSNNVSSLNFNNINTLKLFINTSVKFNSKLILKSLFIILYQYGYKEAENNYLKYSNLDKLTKCNMINSSLTELLSLESISCALDKRSLLNPILFLLDDDAVYKNINEESSFIFFLNFLIGDIQKKFIKFSVDFSNFAFNTIDNLDIPKEDYFNEKHIKSIKILLFLYDLLAITTNLSKISTKFCSSFQKNSQNGILVLLHLLTSSNIEQYLLEQTNKSDLFYVLVEEVFDAALSSLLNLSRMSFKHLRVWHETVDPILILYDVAHNFSGVNDSFTLGAYIVITNIVSDKEISNLTVKAKHVIGTIVDKIEIMVAQLETEPSENVERIQIYLDDDDETPVDIVTADSWHLGELIQALVTFSKSDYIKYIVYAEQNMKEILRKIVYFGNEAEKEFAFQLLYQLSFDERIAKDIYEDKRLYNFIVNLTKSKNCQCIKWVINSKLDRNVQEVKETPEHEENKHVMISYNKESREFCCKIKAELEKLDIKCWIDVDDINGSSLEAMTTAIEQSFCILVCMTEKYKEVPDCRLEAEYIIQRKKPFIPLIMQRNYKPDGWLGTVLGAKDFIDTTKYEFEDCLNKIAKEITNISRNKPAIPIKTQPIFPVESKSDENKAEPFNWQNSEVTKWLNEKNFNANIVSSVKNFNGELLFYLFRMNLKSLNFFNEKINSESYSPLNLYDLIYFNCELEKLFKNTA